MTAPVEFAANCCPRTAAQAIVDGRLSLADVPTDFQDFVAALLSERDAVIWCAAARIASLPTLKERRAAILATAPALRRAVQVKVAELWRAKAG